MTEGETTLRWIVPSDRKTPARRLGSIPGKPAEAEAPGLGRRETRPPDPVADASPRHRGPRVLA